MIKIHRLKLRKNKLWKSKMIYLFEFLPCPKTGVTTDSKEKSSYDKKVIKLHY